MGARRDELAVFDLTALMVHLECEGEHLELVDAIRRAADVSSAHKDLDEALMAIRLLRRLTSAGDDTPIDDGDLTTIVGSLMTSAIILYARATDTKPIDRRPWFGIGKLAAELRPVHSELMRLRNKEIAHFGRGQPVDGEPLLVEALVFRPFDPIHPRAPLPRRAHTGAALARRADALVAGVLEMSLDAAGARQTGVFRILFELPRLKDPVIARLRDMPLVDAQLRAMEGETQRRPSVPGRAKDMRRVAIVEIHADPVADPSE